MKDLDLGPRAARAAGGPVRHGHPLLPRLLPLLLLTLLCGLGRPGAARAAANCVTLFCPPTIEILCAPPEGAIVPFKVTGSSTCARVLTITCTPPSGSLFPPGTNTVVCLGKDSAGNQATCSFDVVVHPAGQPVITAPASVQASCTDANGSIVAFSVTASSPCSTAPVTVTCTPPSGSRFPIGTNLVTCVATDSAGASSTTSFPVIVTGDCGACLELTCPPERVVADANESGVAVVQYDASVRSLCGDQAWVLVEPPSGTTFPVGISQVSVAAGIGDKVLKQCTFSVWVRDVTPPTISSRYRGGLTLLCQGFFGLGGEAGALVNFTGIKVKDNADPAPVLEFTPPSGSLFPLGTNLVTATARDHSGNQSTLQFPVVVRQGAACEVDAGNPQLDPTDNWDFELGLKTWTRSGDAFEHQPTVGDNVHVQRIPELKDQYEAGIGGDYWKDLEFPIGHHGEHWIGTAENHPDDSTEPGTLQGDVKTGTLLSKPFVLTERFITFLIGGKADLDLLRVELWVHAEPGDLDAAPLGGSLFKLVKKTTGHDSERMRREAFDAGDYVGQFCRIRIVDLSSTGHLNVDDFRFQPAHPLFTKVRVGGVEHESVVWFESHLYDWDSPVWGLADMHTHPMAHLGLGRKIFHGQPDGDLKEALSDCNCDHGGWGLDNPCGNYLRQIAVAAFDSEAMNDHQLGWDPNQWKRFQKWPIFTSYSHQQMWHEWVKRAYDGGLRVMVALTVHNHLLAQATINSVPPLDDQSVMMTQITELKAFVDRHSDFLEIAYDPFQLRDIVRRNKLAIIIGSETDDIGNFDQNPLVSELGDELSKTLVRGRLQELHDAGLRYIFPVHLTDNKFAGTAVYNALFAVATKFYMGEKLQVEGADGGIQYKLPDLNAAHYLPSAGDILGKMAEALVNPVAPVQMMVELNGQVMGSHQNLSDSSMGLGAVSSVSLLPVIASVGVVAAPVLIDFFGDFASLKLPEDIYPLGNNYPPYASIGVNHTGHRNAKPLTQLGDFAIREMMRLGMMIDLDHMDERGVTNVLAVAEQVPGGYPLNSGHNSFRAIRYDASENQRTPDHLQRIQKLGGMMGLGWGNTDTRYASEGLGHNPTQTSSAVDNDSPGSSKTFAQAAEYALEFMGRRQVALGTDINGFVVGPGPRFGPQSGFGQREENLGMRSQFIAAQENGILYEEREGRPGTTAVFNGHAVDQDKDDQDARTWLGYRYNKQQRDFFVALRIFRWGWSQDPKMTAEGVQEITDNMNHDGYDWNRVKEFARGLLLGPGNGDAGSDIDPDVNVKQKLAKAVYRRKTFGEAPPDEIFNDTNRYRRYKHFIKVWEDYEKVYGQNTPMKRAETDLVQWDYNWDGLAHYGLLPDFFQDLSNVGLKPEDMSPLFNSSEGVARMWTRCLDAADAIQHPFLHVIIDTSGSRVYFQWYGELGDLIEESTDVEGRSGWHAFKGVVLQGGPASAAVIPVDPGAPIRFYRIRKP